jgi:hypothetical protein
MQPLDAAAVRALRSILVGQPMTDGKLGFAWRIAAGPSLGRAAKLSLSPTGALVVRARTEDWRREIVRARPLIEARLAELLGPGVVRRITVIAEADEIPGARLG